MDELKWNQYLCFIFITTQMKTLPETFYNKNNYQVVTFAQKIMSVKKKQIKPPKTRLEVGFRRFFGRVFIANPE
jgi:hypothetical protein